MILTVDIGNTNIVFGGFDGEELKFTARIATDITRTEDEYASKLLNLARVRDIQRTDFEGAIISSVVPPLTVVMQKAVSYVFGVEAKSVGPGIKTGLKIHCDMPSSVGADIICCGVAAHNLYGSPALVVDMGTATKFILIDDTGCLTGVSIAPGVVISLNALAEKTAQLPKINLENPGLVMAKNTIDCMKSGVIYGNAAMIDGMIQRTFVEFGKEIPVYATGGLAPAIVKYCRQEITSDDKLVLEGLRIIYSKNRK